MGRNKIIYGVLALLALGSIGGAVLWSGEKKLENVPVIEVVNAEEKNEKENYVDDAKMVEKQLRQHLKREKEFPFRNDGKKVVYLTFDDGPSTTVTPEILKILEEEKIKATFFVLGSSIDASKGSKEMLKEIVKDGHAIANHTYTHDYRKLYPGGVINPEYFIKEIKKTEKSIKKVLGDDFETRVVRFPGGYWTWEGRMEVKKLLDKEGYVSIDWNALNGDAEGKNYSRADLVENVENTVNALGEEADMLVLLMHDTYGKEDTAETLRESIKFLKDKGFEFRTIK